VAGREDVLRDDLVTVPAHLEVVALLGVRTAAQAGRVVRGQRAVGAEPVDDAAQVVADAGRR
jgi:hypothetical protein